MRPTMRRFFHWLAFVAVLMNALAPSVSHALAASRPAIPIDVCSVHGGAPLAAAAALLVQEPGGAHHAMLDDCGYCITHGGAHGLLPPTSLSVPLPLLGEARPYLFYHAPRPLLALSAAPPRGPPAFA